MELEGHRKEISMKTVRQATKKWEPTYSKYAAKKSGRVRWFKRDDVEDLEE